MIKFFKFRIMLMLALPASAFAQEQSVTIPNQEIAQELTLQDSVTAPEKKWDINLDVVSMYIWRGQAWGGRYVAFQPSFNYQLGERWSVGVWGTTNMQDRYYEKNGLTPRGYQEFDFGITYQIKDYLSVSLWDYYWPTFESFEGVDQSYFNYGPDGVKSVDATIEFDFSDGYKYPFNATISTLIAGNDYRYDDTGENATRNFTTYVEVGYTISDIFEMVSAKTLRYIDICPTAGAVLNNQAEYYTYGDYDRVSLVNLALNMSREFELGNGIMMPLSIVYTHNAAKSNTEIMGHNFVTAGISFYY
ncbi:MAG TPA: hypothetical protein VGB44_07065 [Flavobacterium sp.]